MVIEMLAEKLPGQRPLAEFLRPRSETAGAEPEERVVFGGVSWEDYLAVDGALGDDRPGPRLYCFDGVLEMMSTSDGHELLRTWIGGFVEDFLFERGIHAIPRGEATMRILEEAGAEPDESWCLHEEKTFPDLLLEMALTSGGIPKLQIYRRFQIPEVWFWRREKMEVWVLREDGYERVESSSVLSCFDFALLARCLAMMPRWNEARRAFREGLRVRA